MVPGERINASRFETFEQPIHRRLPQTGIDLFEAQSALQHIPYEGFPNADMDMQGNVAAFFNARYSGGHEWGDLHINAFLRPCSPRNERQRTGPLSAQCQHHRFRGVSHPRAGQDFGYRVDASIVASTRDTVRIGNELHAQTLDDRWPGPPAGMMYDYISINGGSRAQLGTFSNGSGSGRDDGVPSLACETIRCG